LFDFCEKVDAHETLQKTIQNNDFCVAEPRTTSYKQLEKNNHKIIPTSSKNCVWRLSKNASEKHLQKTSPQIENTPKIDHFGVPPKQGTNKE
jgi:hypothetical protein